MAATEKALLTVTLLGEIAQTISRSGPDSALAFLVESALSLVEASGAILMIPHGKIKEMVLLVENHSSLKKDLFDESFRSLCYQIYMNDARALLSKNEMPVSLNLDNKFPQQFLFEPVFLAGNSIGLLTIYRIEGEPFSAEDSAYIEILAPFMGVLIENSRLHTEMLHKDSRLSALYDISQRAESIIDLRDAYDSLEDVAGSFIDFDRFAMYFVSSDGSHLETQNDVAGLPFPAKIALGEGPIGKAAFERKPYLNYTDEFKSLLILPLIVSEKLVGVAVVASKKSYAYRDEDIIGLRIIATQIASIDEMFKDLVRLRGFTQHILQSMSSGVLIFDNNGLTTFSNSAMVRIIGQPVPLGWSPSSEEVVFPGNLQLLFREVLETRIALENKKVVLEAFFPPRTLEVNAFPFRDESGNILGTAFFIRDITQNIQLEERLKRADRLSALGVLAAGVAHEIRNPLTGMKMIVQILMSEFPPEDSRLEPLQIVQNEIDRLERIIGNLLDFAKPSKSEAKKVEVREILDGCVLLIQNQLTKSGITLKKNFPQEKLEIIADPGQLKQVFLNILTNSIQASKRGGEIEISLYLDHDFVVGEFKDTGSGISKDLMKVIFDPFVTSKDDGTGLGLSVVLRIIEDHGGKIDVISTEGEGSTFTVFLPHFQEKPRE